MDKASAYGAGDCRFESCRGHCKFMRKRDDYDCPSSLYDRRARKRADACLLRGAASRAVINGRPRFGWLDAGYQMIGEALAE